MPLGRIVDILHYICHSSPIYIAHCAGWWLNQRPWYYDVADCPRVATAPALIRFWGKDGQFVTTSVLVFHPQDKLITFTNGLGDRVALKVLRSKRGSFEEAELAVLKYFKKIINI